MFHFHTWNNLCYDFVGEWTELIKEMCRVNELYC
jgi:hypothetical protein